MPPGPAAPSPAEASRGAGGPPVEDVAGALAQEGVALGREMRDRITAAGVDIGYGQRIMSGPLTTAALGEMGARGATIGRDVYVRQDILTQGGPAAAATVAHELTHANQPTGMSVESAEAQAYQVEAAVSQSFNMSELAREQPAKVPGKQDTSGPGAKTQKESKEEVIVDELADAVLELWTGALQQARWRQLGKPW
jgi:hypothetical protein